MRVWTVVLDTNIFVAAGFNVRSNAARLVDGVRDRRLRMIWTYSTRAEAEHILRRIPRLSWERSADLFRPADRFPGEIAPADFEQVSDPADRIFAALAHAANVPLVTQDQALLEDLALIGVPACTAHEFVDRCGL